MAWYSISEGHQGVESEGRLVDVERKGFIYVCTMYFIYAPRGILYRAEEWWLRWWWQWYALFIGAGGLISTETFIVQLRRTFVSLHGFSFHTIIFVVCVPIYTYRYIGILYIYMYTQAPVLERCII